MDKIGKSMHEFSEGKLHSGSKKGPVVKSRKQAIAIGLSEARKAGEHVAPKHHSFESSNLPYGHATAGPPNQHHIEQGHKTEAGHHSEMDGAGRHGHDESGHRHYSEHKEPRHPAGSHTKQGYDTKTEGGAFGYPGEHMRMDHEHQLVGGNYKQSDHEPAVLKTPDGQGFTAGHTGISAGIGAKPHGFGHQAHQRQGVHRLSGAPNAHRIGQRKS